MHDDTHQRTRTRAGAPAGVAADLDAAVAALGRGRDGAEMPLVRRAFDLARQAHAGQQRASGEPFVAHPLEVARILADLGLDQETLCAAVLHDVVEDTGVPLERIEREFGPVVARLVDGVTKMDAIRDLQPADPAERLDARQVMGLRKLLLAMAEDVRVVLVKLADRLHNLRTLKYLPDEKRQRIARETLEIYAPLASRLGIWQIKWEMEDLSFRYLEPETYHEIAARLDERRDDRERYIDSVVRELTRELAEAGVKARIAGRPKHIYSIARKMRSKGLDFEQVYDVRGVRVLVDDVADCYAALGVVHTLWQHIPREFDDYVTKPKNNFYRSLHTAVIGPEGRTLEVQIRTHEMHAHAELGVAAHWAYKERADRDRHVERRVAWLRQVIDGRDDHGSPEGFLDRFRTEVLHDRVYVFTPRGDVVDLPKGATPLDFAYHIHTDVGHRCRGAKLDGALVALNTELATGQKVEVLTSRQGSPSRDWLNANLGYLATARARAKVRHWFRQQDHAKSLSAGRELYERELRRLGLERPDTAALAARFNFKRFDDLLAGLGHGDVSTSQLAGALQEMLPVQRPALEPRARRAPPAREAQAREDVRIVGVGNLLTQVAGCCKPVPREPIVGYITRGRGVTVHRSDCRNVLRLGVEERARLVDVSWSGAPERTYSVDVRLAAYDRHGLLRDVSTVVANERVNVVAVSSRTDDATREVDLRLTLEVTDLGQLSRVLDRLAQLPNVTEARREV